MREIPTEPISFLMPVCNEEPVIREVIDEWRRDVLCHLTHPYEWIFDDCSSDGTTEILSQLCQENPAVRVIRSERDGFFNAAMRLYRAAQYPVVFFTDSDGQYIPDEFWRLTPYLADHDIVHGAKVGRKDPLYRLAASGAFNALARMRFRTQMADMNSAFRLVRRSVLEQLLPKVRHLPMLLNAEMLLRAEREGFRIQVVPVGHRPRRAGRSRGLPTCSFLRECWRAARGLRRLEDEYR